MLAAVLVAVPAAWAVPVVSVPAAWALAALVVMVALAALVAAAVQHLRKNWPCRSLCSQRRLNLPCQEC